MTGLAAIDAMIRAAQVADLPPLLAAMADHFGDHRFLDARFRPARPRIGVAVRADGDFPPDVSREARELVRSVLADGVPTDRRPGVQPHDILTFLTDSGDSPFAQRLDREVSAALAEPADLSGASFAVIGGGLSGICAAIKLGELGAGVRIFEKEEDLGGTWLLNAYPGCRLDTSNFAYSFSFAQRSDWDYRYSPREEVLAYLHGLVLEYGLRERAVTAAVVEACTWSEDDCEWSVRWRNSAGERSQATFDFVISAVGQLNRPKVPHFEGLAAFEGDTLHSSQWTQDTHTEGRSVGVIGTGASGFQIVPEIVHRADSLSVFVRNPPWLLPEPAYEDQLTPEQKALFRGLPTYHTWYRFWMFWAATEGRLPLAVVDPDWDESDSISALNESFRQELLQHLREQYEDRPDLLEKMTPHYPPGGKRMPRDSGRWAKALKDPKVAVVSEPIERFTPGGIRTTDGVDHPLDLVVFATGFEADRYLPDIRVVGAGGRVLAEYWGERPRAYLGISVPEFPNFFMLYGPNTNLVVNGSLAFLIESALDYIACLVSEARSQGAQAIDTEEEALERFIAQVDAGNARRAWGVDSVSNWYKNSAGVVTQTWPFGLSEYWELTREPSEGRHRFLARRRQRPE